MAENEEDVVRLLQVLHFLWKRRDMSVQEAPSHPPRNGSCVLECNAGIRVPYRGRCKYTDPDNRSKALGNEDGQEEWFPGAKPHISLRFRLRLVTFGKEMGWFRYSRSEPPIRNMPSDQRFGSPMRCNPRVSLFRSRRRVASSPEPSR